jgi:hypothetical protein
MSTETRYQVTIRGIRPLIIHSDKGLDPKHPLVLRAKEIQANKRTKDLDENVAEMEWLKYAVSFYGGLNDAPAIPIDNVLKCIQEAGFSVKRTGAKEVASGVDIAEDDDIAVVYKGPRTPRAMFDHVVDGERPYVRSKSVRIPPGPRGKRVPLSRPRIPEGWTMNFTLVKSAFSALSDKELRKMVENAGTQVGLCDWRPRYGRFEVTQFERV